MNHITAKTTIPKFQSGDATGFSTTLRQRVDDYFNQRGLSRRGGTEITVKTLALITLFVVTYALLLSNRLSPSGIFFSGLAFGLTHVLIVFNIAHDAAHNALFDNNRLNRMLSYSFNVVGASAYLWNITHNKIHHTYPNVGEYDPDIHQQAPFIRVSPSVKKRWYHHYQPYFATLLYMIYSPFLVFVKDFQDIRLIPKSDSKLLAIQKHRAVDYIVFFLSKIAYYGYTIVIPSLVIDVSWQQFLIGYTAIQVCMSLFLAAVLIPVHMVDESPFAMTNAQGSLDDHWTEHVFKNTTDYSRKSKWANVFFGGLNTHLVHHLFPGVCHVHYIELSEILKKTAEEFHLTYHELTMGQAIASHYRLLRRMAA
ncbi:MAG: acyl-CoA desaturase [Cyclobacteriaceae bacterium]|nr:acyl-CoA desaturase [Cyclobacteriaceae bacterium]